jgi:ABC-2 type transport system ATP-binding protein
MKNNSESKIITNQTTSLQIFNLTKNFGNLVAVNDLSLSIYRNEIFGLLGPNGAGKTTTINMICGLLPSSEGTIKFTGYSGRDYKSLIGYCSQENIFYPKLTCLEQLIFIGRIYNFSNKILKSRALELLELLGMKDKTNERAARLSGGMKRRLNICLALIHDPEILILDEPEAGLDPQSRILVRDFIRIYGKQKTIILTTHNMDEADRLADRIAIMDYGKLLLLDTPNNLKRTIGEGDILEIVSEKVSEECLNETLKNITALSLNVTKGSNSLLINHRDVLVQLPAIRKVSEQAGFIISEIRLRENTLEDVFIHLTGRNLRQ